MSAGDEYDLKNRYPIHRACRDGDTKILGELLQRVRESKEKSSTILTCEDSFYGWTPMHWAAKHGQLGCIQMLSWFVSDDSNHDGDMSQPIWSPLLNVRARNFRQTPIHLAAYGNQVECLKWLLDAGGFSDTKDSMGETAVHKAARGDGVECLGVLMANGAELRAFNNAGETAADIAAARGCFRFLMQLQSVLSQISADEGQTKADEESADMDIDQNSPSETVFVSGSYGFQPHYSKPEPRAPKRANTAQTLGAMNDGKRCKKNWKKDEHNQAKRENSYKCSGRSCM